MKSSRSQNHSGAGSMIHRQRPGGPVGSSKKGIGKGGRVGGGEFAHLIGEGNASSEKVVHQGHYVCTGKIN